MKTAVEIYKLLPKTNCGTCGTPTCFGFAAKMATNQATTEQCVNMSEAAREILEAESKGRSNSPGTVYEQVLESLKPRVGMLDFTKTAALFGAKSLDGNSLEIVFLNEVYIVTKEGIVDSTGREPRPWISILIYNHLCMPAPPLPKNEWITFSSVPASHAKDKAWAGHVEDVIAKHFSGNLDGLRKACASGGIPSDMKGSHDAAFEFRFFPHYPALLLFYDAVEEENFPAQCKLLLDKTAPNYLDIESMVVLAEEFAGRLLLSDK